MKIDLCASVRRKNGAGQSPLARSLARRLFILAFLLLVAADAQTAWQFYRVASRIAENEKILAVQHSAQKAKKDEEAAIKEKIDELGQGMLFVRPGDSLYEFIAALSGAAEGCALLSRLEYGGREVRLFGEAEDERGALLFAERVRHLVSVLDTRLPEIRDSDAAGQAGKRFTLLCTLR